jgi:hypothetical protein
MMKKVFLTWIAAVATIVAVNAQVSVWDGSHEEWTNGSGTKDDPYLIESAAHLAHLAYMVNNKIGADKNLTVGANTYYKLTTDIDLNRLGWDPIGDSQFKDTWNEYEGNITNISYFGGYFNGNKHTISNLSIRSNSRTTTTGLFGRIYGATIRDLGIVGNSSIDNMVQDGFAGAIAGYCNGNTTIINCYNTIPVTANNAYRYATIPATAGGIIGVNDGVITIINCYNSGNITSDAAGGIIGRTANDTASVIFNCYNTGTIVANSVYLINQGGGGIVGIGSRFVNITNCYNTGIAKSAIGSGAGVEKYKSSYKYTSCYVLNTCTQNIPGEVQALTETFMKSPEFVEMLGPVFMQDVEPYQNAGYPVHSGLLLETLAVSDITQTSVTLNAAFASGNTTSAIQKGFQYKTFTADDSLRINLTVDTEAFSYNLTGLPSGRAYLFKPFVVTAPNDTTYGIERSFTTIHNGSREIWDGSITPVTPDGDAYYIYYPDELAWIAQQCNNGSNTFAGKNVVLMNDLDLNGSDLLQWTPIGYPTSSCELNNFDCRSFAGDFEGNHHTIYNMYINKDADGLGLFGSMGGATVSNLSVADGSITAVTAHCGALVGYASGNTTITNCHSSITISGSGFLGGIVGVNYGARIENCSNTGNITSGAAGGIVAWLYDGAVIDCRNSGTIRSSNGGGIAGQVSKGEIRGCYNTGTVFGSCSSSTEGNGGIVGTISYGSVGDVIVTNCHNKGDISSVSSDGRLYFGGIVGQNSRGSGEGTLAIINCSNAGNISIVSHCERIKCGGIISDVGYVYNANTITYCSNTGNITISDDNTNYILVGGIVAEVLIENADIPISNCYNTGDIVVSNNRDASVIIGGIAGNNYSGIHNCYNTGNISFSGTGWGNVGGVSGFQHSMIQHCAIINSYNAGALSSNGNVGGLDGHLSDFGYPLSINSYYNNTNAYPHIGTPKQDSDMKTAEFVALLNSGVIAYRQDTVPYINKGYPVLYPFEMEAIKTFAATSVTQTTATLNGYVNNPVFPMSAKGFMYKEASEAAYTVVEVTGDSDTLAYRITGLRPGTSYQYRTFGVYQGDTIYSLPKPFATLPIVLNLSVSDLSASEVTLTGSMDSGDAVLSSKHIEYRLLENGPLDWWDNDTIPWINAGEDLLSVHLTGLSPNRYYESRLAVVDSGSNSPYYSGQSFVTFPIVETLPATDITQTTATLNAAVTLGYHGLNGYFEYKLASDEQYGIVYDDAKFDIQTDPFSYTTGSHSWEQPLLPGKEYHFRAVVNGIYGQVETFTTLSCSVDSIRLEPLTLPVGFTVPVMYTVYPENATNQNIEWISNDTTIVTVSQAGFVTARQIGTAKIIAVTEDGGHTDTCEVTVISSEAAALDFESDVAWGWFIENGSQANKWIIGEAAAASGVKSAYISSDGTNNKYDINQASIVHIYHDVYFTPADVYQLSFDWRGMGETGYDGRDFDYLGVYLVETSVNPVAGSKLAETPLATYLWQSTWQQANITIPHSYAGTYKRLVFTWINNDKTAPFYNYAGTQPPAAIDNISFVCKTVSSDASLQSLTVSSGSLSFDANTTNYTVNVSNDVTSIDVTGTANHAAATVTGNVTGKTLEVGDNVVNIVVTAEDETTTKTYTVTIHRVSNDATLSNLTVSSGALSFNPNTTNYTVNVANDVTSIDVTGTANHDSATVSGNVTGKTLEVGDNTLVEIVVTAEDGTTKTYTVTVHRVSNDAALSSLTVSSGSLSFDANTTNYTVNVSNDVTSIDVTGTANHAAATVTGNITGKPLAVGENTVTITVMAEDGITTMTYTVVVTRENAPLILTAFTLNNGNKTALYRTVDLTYIFNRGLPTHFMVSEHSDLSEATWQPYVADALTYTLASDEHGEKTVYTRLKNDFGETDIVHASIYYKPLHEKQSLPAESAADSHADEHNWTVKLFPNPVENHLQVKVEDAPEYPIQVTIYSVIGTVYLSQEFNDAAFSIDLSRYTTGILLVKLSSGNQYVIKQIVKL